MGSGHRESSRTFAHSCTSYTPSSSSRLRLEGPSPAQEPRGVLSFRPAIGAQFSPGVDKRRATTSADVRLNPACPRRHLHSTSYPVTVLAMPPSQVAESRVAHDAGWS